MFGFGQTQPQASQSSFSFGPASTAPSSTFAFGSSSSSSTTPSFQFGASTTSTAPSFNFGAATTQSQATSTFGTFGATQSTQPTFNFGSTQPTNTLQQSNTLNATQQSAITLQSRYTELPPQYQSIFTELETHIRTQNTLCYDITQYIQSQPKVAQLYTNQRIITELNTTLNELSIQINNKLQQCELLSTAVDSEIRQCELTIRTVTKLTQTDAANTVASASLFNDSIYLPSQYHWNKLTEFNTQLTAIKQQCIDIEQTIQFIQSTSNNSVNELYSILQQQQHILTQLIGKIAVLDDYYHTVIVKAKSLYGSSINTILTNKVLTTTESVFYKPLPNVETVHNNQITLSAAATQSIADQHQATQKTIASPPTFSFTPLGAVNNNAVRKKRTQ